MLIKSHFLMVVRHTSPSEEEKRKKSRSGSINISDLTIAAQQLSWRSACLNLRHAFKLAASL